jgi:predicted RNA binding protein YcfA (HicA-like mRNA interferase family)
MTLPAHVWDQVKNLTADDLCAALVRDLWTRDFARGAVLVYRSRFNQRVTIHYHPSKTYGKKLLQGLLADIGWAEADLRRLKLIK